MQPRNRKRCSKCLKLRPVEDFAPHQGKGHHCRTCYTDYFKTYNAKRYASKEARQVEIDRGRKKYRDNVRPLRMERKKRLLLMLGGKCVLCGYNKSAAALDFDHIATEPTARAKPNPIKCRTISHLLAQNTPDAFEQAAEEAKKCRILCANCHRENTFPGHELNERITLDG